MDDSFSRLAKQLRQKKINQNEIKKIKREIIDGKVLNIIKADMASKIQKHIRGYLYRKKYKNFLEKENTEIIINYLYEKKLTRIKIDYKNIISYHILNYIKCIREEKEKVIQKKINSIELIKAVLKGIIFRKNFSNKISPLNNNINKLEKYIISYKIKLILRSNNIQSLLIDIANIKYSLNNLDKSTESSKNQKVKELTTKLNKNINLFYFTFYQMKENSNWISQTKISEPWLKKYLSIINKSKNIFVKKKTIYSNQKKIKRLKENNKNTDNKRDIIKSGEFLTNSKNNTISNDKDIFISNIDREKVNHDNKENKNIVNYNKKYLLSEGREKVEKSYNFNFYDSESDENNSDYNKNIKKFNQDNDLNINLIKRHSLNTEYEVKTQMQKSTEKKNRNNIFKRYKQKKSEAQQKIPLIKSNSSENLEENNIKTNEFKKADNKEDNNILIEKPKESNHSSNSSRNKKLNKYQQREERPIKPLTNINFLENDNPFGLKKEISNNLTETNKNIIKKQKSLEKRIISSNRTINRVLTNQKVKVKEKENNISENEKEETIKTQEKTELSHEELPISNKYLDYDNRPIGGNNNINSINIKSERVSNKFDRNEVPLGGSKNIDYQAMFGEGAEEIFSGDPFGGSKQLDNNNINKEKNKKIHNRVNNNTKKKPVYDARKAIEEAKLKEAKEGKKEKPSAFREFLKEMKKLSAEEKAQHNETKNLENKKIDKTDKIKEKEKNKDKEMDNNNLDNNIENIENNKKKNKGNKLELKEDNYVKSTKNIMDTDYKDNNNNQQKKNKVNETKEINLRKKLHELEKAPAPVLNIKGIKSRIECWGANNDIKRNRMNTMVQREMPKSKDEKKTKNNKSNNQKVVNNIIGNKKMKELNINENNNNNNKKNNSNNDIPKVNKNSDDLIEKYVDKKLMQLSIQIEEIDALFNLDNYYKEKENKMKKFINVPYIQKDFEYIIKYSNESYEDEIQQIQLVYKELK